MTAVLALGSMRQSRAIEVRANRPMMTAKALPPEGAGDPLKFLVTNRGRTVARNVSVSFEPPLPHPDLERLNASSDTTFSTPQLRGSTAYTEDGRLIRGHQECPLRRTTGCSRTVQALKRHHRVVPRVSLPVRAFESGIRTKPEGTTAITSSSIFELRSLQRSGNKMNDRLPSNPAPVTSFA